MRAVFCLLLWFSLVSPTLAGEAAGFSLEFSPQGAAKNIRQATARFSEAMVKFGDPRAPAPFEVACPAKGAGRWVDGRNWVFDFERDVPAGLRCAFTLKPGLQSLAGAGPAGPGRFEFSTGGPSALNSLPDEGSGEIDENPLFVLKLDAPAAPDSVAAHVYCTEEEAGERIPADAVQGQERVGLLGNESLRRQNEYFFEDAPEERLLVLRCRRAFPPETAVQVVLEAGLASPAGVARDRDQVLKFTVRPAFTARFGCERVNAKAQCIPFLPMSLDFSAPIASELARQIQLLDPQGKAYPAEVPEPAKQPGTSALKFKGPFPANTRFKLALPPGLKDDAGRALENAGQFPLEVATDDYPPLAKFNGEFGILEAKEGGVLPVTLRNLEPAVAAQKAAPGQTGIPGQWQRLEQDDHAIAAWLGKVEKAARTRFEEIPKENEDDEQRFRNLTGAESVFGPGEKTEKFDLPKPAGAKEFEVVGIPLQKPGFYVVELASPRLGAALLGEERPRYVATAALVTNLSVHFKWGRESSLVWVTSLDQAQPAAGAEVRISDFCTGQELWRGRTGADGTARIGAGLPEANTVSECYQGSSTHPLFISARTAEDMSFAVSGWTKGIEPYSFGLEMGYEGANQLAHAVFDRSLFRAGETVSMKFFLRRRASEGFAAYTGQLPDAAQIQHVGSEEKFTVPLSFDGQGIALASWEIPKEAKLGAYQVTLYRGEDMVAETGTFQVEQFRVPTMKATLQPAADYLVNAQEAKLDVFVNYLSGGGAGRLPVKLRSQVRSRYLSFGDYPDYQFGGADVKEGLVDNEAEEYGEEPAEESSPAQTLPLVLDPAGAARATIPNLPKADSPKELLAELEYQDANGQLLSVSRRIPLWPAGLALGIKQEGWAASKEQLRFQVVALNPKGQPVSGQKIKVELFKKTTYSYRKRLVGGFYDYESKAEYQKLDETCDERSDREGVIACELKPGVSGAVMLRATSEDDDGNVALSTSEVWVAAGEDWWFESGPGDRMDVLPEKKAWELGQAARLQVRSPFREATALVTVEREGVLDAYVVPISGKEPVVEVPIKANYAPNVYVSVLAVRGRAEDRFGWFRSLAGKLGVKLEDKSVTALVDLNKPAFKLGFAQLTVGWTPNRLEVKVQPDREVYKVRETARLKVKVARADGGPLPPDAEIALAAVDEGLLELKPNNSWKLLDAMMGRRGIEVYTATAQMQVVGKRHYGRKAIPHGGGGGRQTARELFDTLLLWRGRVALNAQGEADIEVPLNDSLTAFRLAAVANAGAGFFGTGEASIRASQDLMLHSGLPPLVRENDAYQAVFTVRNASDHKLAVTAKAKWAANLPAAPKPAAGAEPGPAWNELPPVELELGAGEAKELVWEVAAPLDATKLTWEASAEAGDGSARDLLKVSQEVIPAVPVRVYQATLAQVGKPLAMPVERPAGAVPGRGGVRVSLRARLGDGLGGVLEYMGRYPYSCMEQRVSKAVATRNQGLWVSTTQAMPAFIDEDGLLKYFASASLRGSDVLTAYVLSIADEAGWAIPEETRRQLLEGLQKFVAGRIKRYSNFPAADLTLRKLAAIEALARHGKASPAMLESISLVPDEWPTSAVLDWLSILKRVPAIPGRDEHVRQAGQTIRSRLNLQGTAMGFSSEDGDRLWWLMVSIDENAVRALLGLLDQPGWREDIPRLASGAIARQRRGHWDTTPANAWGTLALEKFSAAFEAVPVAGYTEAELGGVKKGAQWSEASRQPALNFPWGEVPQTLAVKHTGQGKPWAIVQSRAALPLREPLSSGYRIQRSVEPVEQKQAGVWSKGDVARIKLALEAQADMAWVVVDDPVPAGASILGTGLGGDSQLLTRGEKSEGWVWPAFEERRFEAFRAYYEYVPKGKWTLEYTVRLNNPGRFELPATRVEALYAPEMFGEIPNQAWQVNR